MTVLLIMAVRSRNFTTCARLVQMGVNLNLTPGLWYSDSSHRDLGSSLSFAARQGRKDMVDLLLEAGADIDLRYPRKAAQLHLYGGYHSYKVSVLQHPHELMPHPGLELSSALSEASSVWDFVMVKYLLLRGTVRLL
jgi:ankyrin repeat protein